MVKIVDGSGQKLDFCGFYSMLIRRSDQTSAMISTYEGFDQSGPRCWCGPFRM